MGGDARGCSPQPPPNHGGGPGIAAGVTPAVPAAIALRVPSGVTPLFQVKQAGICISVLQQCPHLCVIGLKSGLLQTSRLQASLAAGVSASVPASFSTSCGALAAASSPASGEAQVLFISAACPALLRAAVSSLPSARSQLDAVSSLLFRC